MTKFRTKYTPAQKSTGEVFTKPSQTVPDQTMSVPEILSRYARGLPITMGKVPIYDGEDDPFNGVNPKTLDLSEIHEIRLQNEKTMKKYEEERKKSDIARHEAELRKKWKEEDEQQRNQSDNDTSSQSS